MALQWRHWELASAIYFVYLGCSALWARRIATSGRAKALAFAAAGLLVTAGSIVIPLRTVLHGWLIPPLLLILAYHGSGCLYSAPMTRFEQRLHSLDDALAVSEIASRTPTWIAESLEIAYSGVYALVPIAFLLYTSAHGEWGLRAERFWTVILVTDYTCFATLPWIQTRPPRQLEAAEPWPSSVRAVNLRLLHLASIRINTFPSGHAAEALALALLVRDASSGIAAASMLFAAIAVSAGAVLGRYHYAADALAGWLLAFCVWSFL